jgi:hypothetical protein
MQRQNNKERAVMVLVMAVVMAAFNVRFAGAQSTVSFTAIGSAAQGDFIVGPGKVELTLNPGETKTFTVDVANRLGHAATFALSAEDMRGSNDPTRPVILLGDDRGPYSLKDYLRLASTSVRLSDGVRATVPVTVSVPANATPGGLYGSVLVSMSADRSSFGSAGGAQGQSPVNTRVGVLVFIRVAGAAVESGQLQKFSAGAGRSVIWNEPAGLTFDLLFANTGSVNLNPHGTITLSGMTGTNDAPLVVDPWFALPGSLRLREIAWPASFLFGRYVATAHMYRGYGAAVDDAQLVIWILPWKMLAGGLIIIVAIVAGIWWRAAKSRRSPWGKMIRQAPQEHM